MVPRYSRKEMKVIWEDYNKYSIWLSFTVWKIFYKRTNLKKNSR